MYPTYRNGARVLVNLDAFLSVPPVSGDVVLGRHPYKSNIYIVKRVSHITEDGRFFLLGDNRFDSSDSRGFGPIRRDNILGKIVT